MADLILRVIDIETTGMEPPAEIIEIGWQDVLQFDGEPIKLGTGGGALYRPNGPIPPETMAVHHITPAMVADRPVVTVADMRCGVLSPTVMVAHNSAFEGRWYTPEVLGGVPLLCTLKAACRVWPDAPGHSNSVLRYWLGLDLDERAMPPHRAQPDAFVTAHILMRLLDHVTLEEMLAWTLEPRVMPRISFGKHKGLAWPDAPADYLDWIGRSDMDADTKWNARRELDRRKTARG